MAINVSLKKLVETGAHFGHQTRRWNPKIREYLYGQQEGIHIFDLTKTKAKLEEALKVLKDAAKNQKVILFVCTKKQGKEKTKEVAQKTQSYYVTERWLGGTLTNFDQILKSVKRLQEIKQKMADGEFKHLTKKERLLLEREVIRMERFLGGIVGLEKTPDLLVVIGTKKETGAIREAAKKGIEVIGIVDSNADPTVVDYPIPMNDDATKALEYVLGLMEEAILAGKASAGKGKKT